MGEGTPDRGRSILERARAAARGLGHEEIDAAHLVIGLCGEGGGVAEAAGLDLPRIRDGVEARLSPGEASLPEGRLPLTPAARSAIDAAAAEAAALGSPSVRSDHLWLGLLAEPGGVLAGVLASLGADPGAVVRAIRGAARSDVPAGPRGQGPVRAPADAARVLDGLRITDAHVHVQPWDHLRPDARRVLAGGREDLDEIGRVLADPGAFLDLLDRQGVRRAALINYVAPEIMGFTEEVNDFVGRFARTAPDRLIPFGGVDPREEGSVVERMRRIIGDLGIRGIKVHPPHQGYGANDYISGALPGLARIYETAQEAGLVLMIHTGTSIFPGARSRLGDPMAADDIATDFPEMKIILAHGGRPIWMETCFFLARRHRNVYLDLSSIPPRRVLEYFPRIEVIAGKVLFGTDWPAPGVVSIRRNLEEFAALPLPGRTIRAILQENPDRLFGPAA